MASTVFWNRRAGHDRRDHHEHRFNNRRATERRHPNSDNYVVVTARGGMDRFAVMMAVLTLLLLVLASYAILIS